MGDLGVHFLLNLQAASESIHHARKLGDSHHPAVGQIAHMDPSDDGRQMMLAMGFKTDVLEDHHVVIARHFLEGAGEIGFRILVIAREPIFESARHSGWRVGQAFAIGIIARPAEHGADGRFGFLAAGTVGHGFGARRAEIDLIHGLSGAMRKD